MSIHFKDAREVLNILRDMITYISIQSKNDELGARILDRAMRVLNDNDNINVGDENERKESNESSIKWYESTKYTNIFTKWIS